MDGLLVVFVVVLILGGLFLRNAWPELLLLSLWRSLHLTTDEWTKHGAGIQNHLPPVEKVLQEQYQLLCYRCRALGAAVLASDGLQKQEVYHNCNALTLQNATQANLRALETIFTYVVQPAAIVAGAYERAGEVERDIYELNRYLARFERIKKSITRAS